jgi:hypothetical protein
VGTILGAGLQSKRSGLSVPSWLPRGRSVRPWHAKCSPSPAVLGGDGFWSRRQLFRNPDFPRWKFLATRTRTFVSKTTDKCCNVEDTPHTRTCEHHTPAHVSSTDAHTPHALFHTLQHTHVHTLLLGFPRS